MGSKVPVLSGREVVRVFQHFGWQVARQASSHVIMTKPGEVVTAVGAGSQRSRARHVEKLDSIGQPDGR